MPEDLGVVTVNDFSEKDYDLLEQHEYMRMTHEERERALAEVRCKVAEMKENKRRNIRYIRGNEDEDEAISDKIQDLTEEKGEIHKETVKLRKANASFDTKLETCNKCIDLLVTLTKDEGCMKYAREPERYVTDDVIANLKKGPREAAQAQLESINKDGVYFPNLMSRFAMVHRWIKLKNWNCMRCS